MENNSLETILTYIIPSLIASIPIIYSMKKSKEIAKAEIALKEKELANTKTQTNGTVSKDIAEGYNKLTADLQKQIDALTTRLEEKAAQDKVRDSDIAKLKAGVRALVKQVKALDPNCEPVFDIT